MLQEARTHDRDYDLHPILESKRMSYVGSKGDLIRKPLALLGGQATDLSTNLQVGLPHALFAAHFFCQKEIGPDIGTLRD